MPEAHDSFAVLMKRVQEGSEVASQELLREYEPYLLHVIRRRLDKRLRAQFDSLDFAQDVWASFFAALPGDQAFDQPEKLAAYLAKMAVHKVFEMVRQRRSLKYDVNRECSLNDSKLFPGEGVPAHQDTPSEIVGGEEEWQAFLRKQPLVYRRIYTMLRQGKTQKEISKVLGLTPQTINRVVGRLPPSSEP
jgi:RNA polymerase sigma factor (sigma-70 family)